MFRTLLATSILAAVAAAPAYADVKVYGKVNVSVQASDDGTESINELKSNASRLGFKGSEKLDGGLTLVYQYEMQVDVTDESGEKNIKSRNQYVGLKGSFGEVLIGRNDTVFKQSQGKFDLFSDYEADIKSLWKGENRMSDSVTYKTPKFNGVQFGISYILDEDNDDSATSISAVYGDKALKKGKYYAAIAIDSEVKGYDATRVTFGTKLGDVKVGAMYQVQESVEDGKEKSGVLVNAQYKMGKNNLKAQYQTLESDAGFTLGVDHKLGKSTKAYAWYSSFNFEAAEDESYLAIGLEHKF
jgi:predicted porin